MRPSVPLAVVALLTIIGASTPLSAQQTSANVTATATVQTRPLSVQSLHDLEFGNLFPGNSKTVAVTDAGAGKVDLVAAPQSSLIVSFELPTNLTTTAPAGVNPSLAIDDWTGSVSSDPNAPGGGSFNPPTGVGLGTGSQGEFFLFIGASVHARADQAAGDYRGTIAITVAYE